MRIATLSLFMSVLATSAVLAEAPPNVVFIMADDVGG